MKAKEVLQSATDVMQDRGSIYGHPKVNQDRICICYHLLSIVSLSSPPLTQPC